MHKYIYGKTSDSNGQHEIHKSTCSYAPLFFNAIKIGPKIDSQSAMETAKNLNPSKCFYMCQHCCHTWYINQPESIHL
ncbi:hypothetical protein [uncultured Vagococcus sp.]|uniref:hypothetical protein n=1 Tax=uncultured Vagococcus sp. TaxID=189676 RepID=UPI0028D79514|nr:hypothetical protein [uncultured Vagococcus sp.]